MANNNQPDFVAIIDQAIEEHKELARLVSRYYFHLIEKNIPPNHAVMLAGSYQKQAMIQMAQEDPE